MELSKKYLHDRLILVLLSVMSALLVVGVSLVLLRYDATKNPTVFVSYRPNVSGSPYVTGKPIDIYLMAVFMALTAAAAFFISSRIYHIRRYLAVYVLGTASVLIVLATIVVNSLILLN